MNEIKESEASDHEDSQGAADPDGSAAGFDGVNGLWMLSAAPGMKEIDDCLRKSDSAGCISAESRLGTLVWSCFPLALSRGSFR